MRNKNNLTQKDIADKLGITPTGISYWESGTAVPNYETLKKVAILFNVSIDYLTGNEDTNTEKDVLFRKIGKVDSDKKDLLMRILINTVVIFIDLDYLKNKFSISHEAASKFFPSINSKGFDYFNNEYDDIIIAKADAFLKAETRNSRRLEFLEEEELQNERDSWLYE